MLMLKLCLQQSSTELIWIKSCEALQRRIIHKQISSKGTRKNTYLPQGKADQLISLRIIQYKNEWYIQQKKSETLNNTECRKFAKYWCDEVPTVLDDICSLLQNKDIAKVNQNARKFVRRYEEIRQQANNRKLIPNSDKSTIIKGLYKLIEKSQVNSSKNQGNKDPPKNIELPCGHETNHDEILERVMSHSPLNGIEIWCPNSECGYILGTKELVKLLGSKYVDYFSGSSSINCMLCGKKDKLIRIHKNHFFCNACKERYIKQNANKAKIRNISTKLKIKCPAHDCKYRFCTSDLENQFFDPRQFTSLSVSKDVLFENCNELEDDNYFNDFI